MLVVHLTVGIAVLGSNLGAGLWGAWAWHRREPSIGFWYLLRAAQTLVVVQIALGALLLIDGREAADNLHYLYGVLGLPVALAAETLRGGVSERELEGMDFDALPRERQGAIAAEIVRRETGIMAVSALVVFGLVLRAALTSPSF
jgi:hypothetical protein